jgi:hypothetical protein
LLCVGAEEGEIVVAEVGADGAVIRETRSGPLVASDADWLPDLAGALPDGTPVVAVSFEGARECALYVIEPGRARELVRAPTRQGLYCDEEGVDALAKRVGVTRVRRLLEFDYVTAPDG